MKAAYPIVMSQGAEYIIVYVPDFDINTQGTDYADAIEMARDPSDSWESTWKMKRTNSLPV